MADDHPLMTPPPLSTVPGLTPPPVAANLAVALACWRWRAGARRRIEDVVAIPTIQFMIQFTHLTKKFGKFTAVDDLSFQMEPRQAVALWGPTAQARPRPSSAC